MTTLKRQESRCELFRSPAWAHKTNCVNVVRPHTHHKYSQHFYFYTQKQSIEHLAEAGTMANISSPAY